MSKLFSIIFIFLFSLVFAKQGNPEKEQLFRKAGNEIVLFPERTIEILDYIEKNFSLGSDEVNRLKFLRLKSFFFQNNLTEVLKVISKKDEFLSPDIIILKNNILYSFHIRDYSFGSSKNSTDDDRLSGKILKLLRRAEREGRAPKAAELLSILKQINSDNAEVQRESLFNLSEYLSHRNPNRQYEFFFHKVNDLYKNDPAFKILYAGYLLKSSTPGIADGIIADLPKEALEQSTNLNLKYQYYDLLVNFYSKQDQSLNYREAVQKKEALFSSIDKMAFSAKNKWFDAVEENFINELDSSVKNRQYLLFSIFGGAVLFVVLILIRLFQIRSQIKEYEEFTARLKVNKDKKAFQPQVISEKTENLLLQKLEDFEKTDDVISPDISLQSLAKKLDTNTKYLSEIINKNKQKNFNSYINELRILYMTRKLKENPVYRNYKIKYLAEESGFSTHSAFAAAFKSVNGISPANYIQLLNHKEE